MRYRFGFLFFVFCVSSNASFFTPQLIRGKVAESAAFKEVIALSDEYGSLCTGTLVGSRVILTAAHCVEDQEKITFEFEGETYTAEFQRSGAYASEDHDMALGLVDKAIDKAKPFSIGGKATEGAKVSLLGFGCTGEDFNGYDGLLREGTTEIVEVDGVYFLGEKKNGALLCPGDSGGPAFLGGSRRKLIGVHSAVGTNEEGTKVEGPNWLIRTDHELSRTFFKAFVKKHKVDICGITKVCVEK